MRLRQNISYHVISILAKEKSSDEQKDLTISWWTLKVYHKKILFIKCQSLTQKKRRIIKNPIFARANLWWIHDPYSNIFCDKWFWSWKHYLLSRAFHRNWSFTTSASSLDSKIDSSWDRSISHESKIKFSHRKTWPEIPAKFTTILP